MENKQNRPQLSRNLTCDSFKSFYYLKEELVDFCRAEGLQTTGSKEVLNERIATYLKTGEKTIIKKQRQKTANIPLEITRETLIEENFVCSQKHRAFFEKEIGKGFSFKVSFQKWLKENSGKTYEEAIIAYGRLLEEKKNSKTEIDKQFEYNTYIRDFFAANTGKSLEDAISCWHYKKSLPGTNKYEASDLISLENTERK